MKLVVFGEGGLGQGQVGCTNISYSLKLNLMEIYKLVLLFILNNNTHLYYIYQNIYKEINQEGILRQRKKVKEGGGKERIMRRKRKGGGSKRRRRG